MKVKPAANCFVLLLLFVNWMLAPAHTFTQKGNKKERPGQVQCITVRTGSLFVYIHIYN